MSYGESFERRHEFRLDQDTLINEFVGNKWLVSSMINISEGGMYTVKPETPLQETESVIQLAFRLPRSKDMLWALGEIMFEERFTSGIGTGIKFINMADSHRKMIAERIDEAKDEQAFRQRRHAEKFNAWRDSLDNYPTPFVAPPPPAARHTIPNICLDRYFPQSK